MRSAWAFGWMAAVAILAGVSARGDGKAFARPGFVRAEIPEQRALIHWAPGVETLVVESVVRGSGGEVAWVVPLPAVPESVEAASRAIFPTLQNQFQPRVEARPDGTWVLWLAGAVLLWGVRLLGLNGFRFAEILAALGVLVLTAVMFLPSLAVSKARAVGDGSSLARPGVEVLARSRAGVFDVTTLAARNPSDLLDWLRAGGFEAPPEIEPVVAELIREGWVFVAARARRDPAGSGEFAMHPLRFRFPAREPVYPMRLTGVGSGPVRVDLYVFGPGRASADGLRATYCGRATYPGDATPREAPLTLRIRQPDLAGLVRGAEVGTKLSGEVRGAALQRDLRVGWEAYRSVGQQVFTDRAARDRAACLGAIGLFAGAVVGLVRFAAGTGSRAWMGAGHLGWCGAWLAGALAYFWVLPRVPEAEVVRVRSGDWRQAMLGLVVAGMDGLVGAGLTNRSAGEADRALEVVRASVAREVADPGRAKAFWNGFTGGPMREEASPGNYTVGLSNGTVVLSWHDFDGAPVGTQSVVP